MIRPLLESDLGELLPIEEIAHIAPWTAETFERCFLMGYPGWVIENQNKVIGFIIATMNVGECHILNVCIHPAYQNQGFGLQLIQYFLSRAKESDVGIVFLEVRRSNHPAIHLYQKLGFHKIGERKNYYPAEWGKEDALVFAKDLGVE